MGRRSNFKSFASIAQVVAEKTNLKANKGEKVRKEEKKPSEVRPTFHNMVKDGSGCLLLVHINVIYYCVKQEKIR